MYVASSYSVINKKYIMAYIPPLDVVSSAVAAYGMRLLKTSHIGPIFRVKRSSDNAELDIFSMGSGNINEQQLIDFVGLNNGYVVKLYDQSGNNLHLANSYYNAPLIIESGVVNKINNKPSISFIEFQFLFKQLNSSIFSSGFTNFFVGHVKGKPTQVSYADCSHVADEGSDSSYYVNYAAPFSMNSISYMVGTDAPPDPIVSTFNTGESMAPIGYTPGKMSYPVCIGRDFSNNIYISNESSYQYIEKYDSNGSIITSFKINKGSGVDQISTITGIGVQPNGNIIVVNGGAGNFLIFNSSFIFINKYCTYGAGTNQLAGASQVAVLANGDFFIADSANNRIVKFSGTTYLQIGTFGTVGNTNGKMSYPLGVSVDNTGNIFVGDTGNNRIQKFNSSFVYQLKVGSSGVFSFITNLSCDSSSNVYVSDAQRRFVQKYNNSLSLISQVGSTGTGDSQFLYNQGLVALSSSIFVVDTSASNMKKFNTLLVYQQTYGNEIEVPCNYISTCDGATKSFESFRNNLPMKSGIADYYSTYPYAYLNLGQTFESNNSYFLGLGSEYIFYGTKLDSTNRNLIFNNQKTYWGTP